LFLLECSSFKTHLHKQRLRSSFQLQWAPKGAAFSRSYSSIRSFSRGASRGFKNSAFRACVVFCTQQVNYSTMTSDPLKKSGLIPDVVDDFTPSVDIEVVFPKGQAKAGEEFHPSDVAKEPKVRWAAEENALYTLINSDPDAPSRKDPKYREWRHWVVTNIPGSDVSKGDVVSSYMGAGPPKGSGLHRYIFLLYKQPGNIKAAKLNDTGMNRASWKVREFAKAHGLGHPVGAAFYVAQNV